MSDALVYDFLSPEEMAYASSVRARELNEQYARAVRVRCPRDNCEITVDPLNNEILSVYGISGCPCDARSRYREGLVRRYRPSRR